MFQPVAGIVCIDCDRSVLRRRDYVLTQDLYGRHRAILDTIIQRISPRQITFNNQERVCQSCWETTRRLQLQHGEPAQPVELVQPVEPAQPLEQPEAEPAVEERPFNFADYTRAPNTSNSCIFYGCNNRTRCRLPDRLKIVFFRSHNYYVPQSARVCEEHLHRNNWEELFDAPNRCHDFDHAQILDIFDLFKKSIHLRVLIDFDNIEEADEYELHYWIGKTTEQFSRILEETPSLSERCRNPKKALGFYLSKLRTGESDERLSTFFHTSRSNFERLIKIARECIAQDFVPRYIGLDHMTREEVAACNLLVPNAVFGNPNVPAEDRPAIIICDGTYVYVQKSSNFLFQKKSYSLHKFRNLLKPFLMVTCNGHILDVTGPHAATKSDAMIVNEITSNENSLFHWFFRSGDVFILDRGFRDSVSGLNSLGYITAMPESRQRGAEQLTTLQANKSRMVTICRWPVEVVNGRFKRDFKLFRQEYFNVAMSHMFVDFKNAAAMINAFHPVLVDNRHAATFADIINSRVNTPNNLADYVIAKNLNRQRVAFERLSADLPELQDFPQLSEDDLIIFALGTYQLKLARSYYSEHVRHGLYTIEVCRDTDQLNDISNYNIVETNVWLLRIKINSRHTSSKVYYCYILINENEQGLNRVSHYYCTCPIGKRTLGCCAHVMCVVWFLGWARHEDNINRPAEFLDYVIDEE